MISKPSNPDYLASPTIYWTIALGDLGVAIPAMIAVGLGMWGGRSWPTRASFAVAGWMALVPVAVAAMGLTIYLDKQPSASLAAIGLLSAMAIVFLVPALLIYLPLVRHSPANRTTLADRQQAQHATTAAASA